VRLCDRAYKFDRAHSGSHTTRTLFIPAIDNKKKELAQKSFRFDVDVARVVVIWFPSNRSALREYLISAPCEDRAPRSSPSDAVN
jgi:hypothetical protein